MITQDKNHIPWNKNHIYIYIPPPRKPRMFSHQSYRYLTGNRQRHSERITLLWVWFLNVLDNVPMDLKYACRQYFTCTKSIRSDGHCNFLLYISYKTTILQTLFQSQFSFGFDDTFTNRSENVCIFL